MLDWEELTKVDKLRQALIAQTTSSLIMIDLGTLITQILHAPTMHKLLAASKLFDIVSHVTLNETKRI